VKCFEVVNNVLTSTYAEIPGNEATKDKKIRACLGAISGQYGKVLTDGGPNFSDPLTRFAYVFMYVPVHSHWVFELITMSKEAQVLFERERFRTTCIGGGPGSDLVGILKYIDQQEHSPSLFCEIVDGCVEWKSTWSDLAYEIELSSPVHTDYVIHDASNEKTWLTPWKLGKSDLITLNFFWSEIVHLGDHAERYLIYALQHAKPGALLLYNDNNDSRFTNSFDRICKESGFKVLLEGSGDRRVYDWGEKTADVEVFTKKFERNPRLTGNLAWRVLVKK